MIYELTVENTRAASALRVASVAAGAVARCVAHAAPHEHDAQQEERGEHRGEHQHRDGEHQVERRRLGQRAQSSPHRSGITRGLAARTHLPVLTNY